MNPKCNSSNRLEIHHRVFRSEGEDGLKRFLETSIPEYISSYGRNIEPWEMNSIQNLVMLCKNCHLNRVHNGDKELRDFFRNSFTCPNTFFNIPFKKNKRTLW